MESRDKLPKGSGITSKKILNLHEATRLRNQCKENQNRIVLCHGVFDLLHPGHIAHFEEAKTHGDTLVVSVTSDEFVNKGPGRPILPLELRASMLAALEIVDFVWLSSHPNAQAAIEIIRPEVYVKGPDYSNGLNDPTGQIQLEIQAVEKFGGKFVSTDSPTMSSSSLLNIAGDVSGNELGLWLSKVRKSVSAKKIKDWFDKLGSLRVLVVGEAIVDSYISVEALGKTSKEPVLAFLQNGVETQLGGSIAIARHIAGLGANTTLMTRVGKDELGEKVSEDLAKESSFESFIQKSTKAKTIQKTRYVDKSSGSKVFETYDMSDEPVTIIDDDQFRAMIEGVIDDFDLILVADYGHSLLTTPIIECLARARGVIAVNTQSNAGNRGFNSISRYPRADIVSLNGGELQLELRKRHSTVSQLLPELGLTVGAAWVVVTEGVKGLSIWNKDLGVNEMPAFTEKVVDRVGAGDALFAATACLLAIGAPVEAVGLFGNLAGAEMVSTLGNRKSLVSANLIRHANILLK
jgi:rfaE bifunctional protein kinase chain/domain/rfaE bifunctional protein nucleotidyltransferase chain/domain